VPTYEYECRNCGHRFEKFQNISAGVLRKCPECGGSLKRLLGTGSAVMVKGSGDGTCDFPESAGACDRETPCCGADEPCSRSPRRS